MVQQTEYLQSRVSFSIMRDRIQNQTRDYTQATREGGKMAAAPIEEEEKVEHRHSERPAVTLNPKP